MSPSTLSFTDTTPQLITVTGVDDAVQDGDVTYSVIIGGSFSVTVVNQDDDTAGLVLGTPSGDTHEDGGSATVSLRLASAPPACASPMAVHRACSRWPLASKRRGEAGTLDWQIRLCSSPASLEKSLLLTRLHPTLEQYRAEPRALRL